MKMPLPLVDQEFIYPKNWAISAVSLSCLQDRRNRLLESIVVLSLEVMLKASTGGRASLFPRQ
jgi:hypothetical protein